MAWEDRNGGGGVDEDLMGVHGDVLFADPLGVRKDKGKSPAAAPAAAPPARNTPQSRSRNGAPRAPAAARGQDRNDLDLNLPAHRNAEIKSNGKDPLIDSDQEEPGPIRAWLGNIFGVGTCCSMRDRSKDAELAKKAAETGRPPAPAPREKENNAFPAPREKAEPKVDRSAPSKSLGFEPEEDLSSHRRKEEPRNVGKGLDALHSFAASEPTSGNRQKEERQRESPPPREAEAEDILDEKSLKREKVPEHTMPRKWQWPAWTLNTKEGCIEVFVTDEDSGASMWCEAEPQFRVVDKEGNDAYLCAEYKWDGEFYVQDFGPHHVRKRGQDATVFQLFAFDPDAPDMLKDTSKSVGRKNIDDTDPFMTTRPKQRNDTGGGVSSWLEKD